MSSPAIELPRVVFEAGSLSRLPVELAAYGFNRIFVVTTRGRARNLATIEKLLGQSLAGSFVDAVEHVPKSVTDMAERELRRTAPDVIVAVGGGSPIGLGKALAVRSGLPLVAVPTTYSGSEMTSIYGETDESGKKTGRDTRALPRMVLYDPLLTLGLPAETSATSGMNALAHSVEAMYAPDATVTTSAWAEQSIRLLSQSLPQIVADISNVDLRATALSGAHFAGKALGATSMGLHHRICHVLGGSFGLPHAKTHSVMLQHVVSFNASHAVEAMNRIANALGSKHAEEGITGLGRALPIPRTLAQLGFSESGITKAAAEIVKGNYPNPRPVTIPDVVQILERALSGE